VDVDGARVAGMWFRHIPTSVDVLNRPAEPADGRWQPGDRVEALYFGEDEPTVWAEWYRFLAEAGLAPMAALPRDLWRWEIDIEVADLSEPARLARVGLATPRPGRHQWPAFQEVGESLRRAGWAGILAPSAARPSFKILCLFRDSDDVHGARPVPPPVRQSEPPSVPPGLTT
jgi:hypothetical protein